MEAATSVADPSPPLSLDGEQPPTEQSFDIVHLHYRQIDTANFNDHVAFLRIMFLQDRIHEIKGMVPIDSATGYITCSFIEHLEWQIKLQLSKQ
jgi:hypothetical protein